MKITVKKKLTYKLFKLAEDLPAVIKITCPMWTGKEIPASAGKSAMEPARLVRVVVIETGEECEMIVNAVLEGILTEAYPNDSYVDLFFQITKHPKGDKGYHTFTVAEVDVEMDNKGDK